MTETPEARALELSAPAMAPQDDSGAPEVEQEGEYKDGTDANPATSLAIADS